MKRGTIKLDIWEVFELLSAPYNRIFASVTILISLVTSASADTLSRRWHSGFGDLGFNRTAEITTFHTPSGTFRVNGRFSSGERILDTKFTATVRLTTSKGEILEFVMYERVPATKFGGTQVRYKSQDYQVPGRILSIEAQVNPNITTPTTVTFRILPEVDPVDICVGQKANLYTNYVTNTVHWEYCDSSTGAILEKTKPYGGSGSTLDSRTGEISPTEVIE